MAEVCLFEVNEKTDLVVTVTFFDEDGLPVSPTAATYRVDDKENHTVLLTTTAFPSLSTSVDLELDGDLNKMVRERHLSEIRTLTVEFDYNTPSGLKHGTAQYRYKVVNLYGVVSV